MGRIKTAVILLFTLALAAFTVISIAVLPNKLLFSDGQSYRFYVGDTSLNCKEVFADGSYAPFARLLLTDVNGESAVYKELDIEKLLISVEGEVVFYEEIEDSKNYYCKANLPYSINLYGEEINLHVCVKPSGVTVASPIIFGGY